MKTPFFTVLVNTYNYGHYVEEAVCSVLAQDFPMEHLEILVVDDGSTDNTAERLRKYGSKIHYLYKPNGGQASAFNLGLQHARGEVIAMLDADDVWLPGKLRRVHEAIEEHPDAGMVYHRVRLWDGASDLGVDTYFIPVSGRVPENRSALLTYPMVGTSCLAFRRSVLQKLLPVPEALRSQADAYLVALIIFLAPVIAVTEFLGKYRLHGDNLFQTNGENVSRERIEHRMAMRSALLSEIERWLHGNGHDTRSPDLRAYLTQWKMAQQKDAFALNAPSRWKYFQHLLLHPWTYGDIMTSRHRAHSYMWAFAALALGYRHLHLLDDAWHKVRRMKKPSSPDPRLP